MGEQSHSVALLIVVLVRAVDVRLFNHLLFLQLYHILLS
jgi:hypothetical protein